MKKMFSKIKSGLIIFLLVKSVLCFGQKDTTQNDLVGVPFSKWPYVGYHIPPHLNVSFGYQGFYSKAYFVGLAVSPLTIYTTGAGACAGPRVYYKQFDTGKKYRSFEAELAIYSFVTFGINYNYNMSSDYHFSGFKPFIGIALYHISINYGYNFFDDKKNIEKIFKHNVFHITLDIPICKLTKKTMDTWYTNKQ